MFFSFYISISYHLMLVYICICEYTTPYADRFNTIGNFVAPANIMIVRWISEEVRDMRKGILSLSLPGMRKGQARKKTGNMANAEKAAERKTAAHEEPKVETKAEKSFVQTIMVPKKPAQATTKRKNLLGGAARRRPEGKKQ